MVKNKELAEVFAKYDEDLIRLYKEMLDYEKKELNNRKKSFIIQTLIEMIKGEIK